MRPGHQGTDHGGRARAERRRTPGNHEGIGKQQMKRKLLIGLLIFCAASWTSFGLSAVLASVETDVVLRSDGKALFFESLAWLATGGQMHGFYFEGAAVRPVFNLDQCYADLAGNVRVGLDISDMGGGKYDVVLAGGRRFTGSAMYFLAYGGDLAGPRR